MESSGRPGGYHSLHGGLEIGPPLFFKVLRQLGVTLEVFQKFRQKRASLTNPCSRPSLIASSGMPSTVYLLLFPTLLSLAS